VAGADCGGDLQSFEPNPHNPHDHHDAVRVLLIGSLLRRRGTLGSE
jgi:hypothetical protein